MNTKHYTTAFTERCYDVPYENHTVQTCRLLFGIMLLTVAGTGKAQDHSVGGLSLGMSNSQVKAKLGAGYSEMLQQPAVPAGEARASVLQHRPPPQDSTRDAYALVYVDDQLISIQHEVVYGNGDPHEPNREQTIEDLKAKFGPAVPSELSPYTSMVWPSRDSSGKPVYGCFDSRGYGIQAFPQLGRFVGAAKPNCSVGVIASIKQGAIVDGFSVWIYDPTKYYNALLHENKRVNQQQAEHHRQGKRKSRTIVEICA